MIINNKTRTTLITVSVVVMGLMTFVTNRVAERVRPTPTPVVTQQATSTVLPPPIMCPPEPNVWHEPLDYPCMHHHHGVNPLDYVDEFSEYGFDLEAFLAEYGELSQTNWLTSSTEDPRGRVVIAVETNVCELFNNGGQLNTEEFGCIKLALLFLHDVGTDDHMVNRFHSFTSIILACNQVNGQMGNICGVMVTGGWHDYGILEVPYKNNYCPLEIDPLQFKEDPSLVNLNQPPYRAIQNVDRGKAVSYWNSLKPNAIQQEYYPHNPNSLVGLAWNNTDAYQIWEYPIGCNKDLPINDVKLLADGMQRTSYTHSNFNVFEIISYEHPPAPFTGWTDQWGHVVPEEACLNSICVPLIITENYPEKALFNKQVINTIKGPYDFFSPKLLPPWLDSPLP